MNVQSTPEAGPIVSQEYGFNGLLRDFTAGTVVFLVALPLCLGIALASGAPLFSGLLAGIIGGIVVGIISGSHTSVSGPAAGLTAIVLSQVTRLGSFEAFLLAVVFGGVLQIVLGVLRAGSLAAFFPTSVIKGLLAAIGVILILKQLPHLVGHDADPEGDLSYVQPDSQTTFSELSSIVGDWQPGAALIGLTGVAVLLLWQRSARLQNSLVPAPLVVVCMGVAINELFRRFGGPVVQNEHLVQIPMFESPREMLSALTRPDWSRIGDPAVYIAGVTIALVASLETLLNLQAVDKLDPFQRVSPPSRELVAQGVGNVVSGMVGGLPITSVIIRGSVNVTAGAQTKLSAVFHGVLLLVCVSLLPDLLNRIPLASLAAILLVTGIRLASPQLFIQMWNDGRYQFLPFIITLVAIVRTDLLIGIGIGLGVSLLFILISNLRRPLRRIVTKHMGREIVILELPNQVSFLNRAALQRALNQQPSGSHLIIDASNTDYMDPDIASQLRDFCESTAPARDITVNLRGFRSKYGLQKYSTDVPDYPTAEVQQQLNPSEVLDLLMEGNRRFRSGERLSRDYSQQVAATAQGQNPLAVVLSCIDSRVPVELIFDLGLGDVFSTRVAGNIVDEPELGSIEYAVAVAGVRLVMVLGHTRCGAVTSTVELCSSGKSPCEATGCQHLDIVVQKIAASCPKETLSSFPDLSPNEAEKAVNEVARRNVAQSVQQILNDSAAVRDAMGSGRVMVVGGMYDISTGKIDIVCTEPQQAVASRAEQTADSAR